MPKDWKLKNFLDDENNPVDIDMKKIPKMKSDVGFSSRVDFQIGVLRLTKSLIVTCNAGNKEKSIEEVLLVEVKSKSTNKNPTVSVTNAQICICISFHYISVHWDLYHFNSKLNCWMISFACKMNIWYCVNILFGQTFNRTWLSNLKNVYFRVKLYRINW